VSCDDPDVSKGVDEELDDGVPDEEFWIEEELEVTELAVNVGELDTIVVALDAVDSVDNVEVDIKFELPVEEELDVRVVDVSVVTLTGDDDGEIDVSDDGLEVDALDALAIEV
jgi:hypothetical protein